jgi:hypothetical protein
VDTQDAEHEHPPFLGRRLVQAIGCWVLLYLWYLLLVDTFDQQEMVAALIVAALGTAATISAARYRMARGAVRLRWLLLAWRLPIQAVRDCGIVFTALWRQVVWREQMDGAFRLIRFDPGGDDPHSVARRALVVAGVSLPPNSFVVAIDKEHGALVIHHLVPPAHSPGGPDTEWPL